MVAPRDLIHICPGGRHVEVEEIAVTGGWGERDEAANHDR